MADGRFLAGWLVVPRRRGRGWPVSSPSPAGTGKTMAAEIIARDLELDVYRLDLSRVVSEWVEETEKALGRLFDEAEAGSAILLFDESDALFGRRTGAAPADDVDSLLARMALHGGAAYVSAAADRRIAEPLMRYRISRRAVAERWTRRRPPR